MNFKHFRMFKIKWLVLEILIKSILKIILFKKQLIIPSLII